MPVINNQAFYIHTDVRVESEIYFGGGLFPFTGYFQWNERDNTQHIQLQFRDVEYLTEYPQMLAQTDSYLYYCMFNTEQQYSYVGKQSLFNLYYEPYYDNNMSRNVLTDMYDYQYTWCLIMAIGNNEDSINNYVQSYVSTEITHSYEVGYSEGHTAGYNEGILEDTDVGDTFTLLGGAFEAVNGALGVEVIGGLTIGGLLGIPLAIGIIVAIFKMIRK